MKHNIIKRCLNYAYFFNTDISIGFNIANAFCNISLFNEFIHFLLRISFVKRYLGCRRQTEVDDEARIVCDFTLHKYNYQYYCLYVRKCFSKWVFEKTIFSIGKSCLRVGFAKDLETSVSVLFFCDEWSRWKECYGYITISLLGFRIVFDR